ncbi:hypothetical protein [Microvirga sp. BSC39]|uniref:hypothetical protein n=1 Tax=Microvirga sp. BSC39 TaxID=1549810 RepID=UPI000689F1D1|nr:hypothetical protein [Microvirga sp. BSC39]
MTLEDPALAAAALDQTNDGINFAHAVHLARAEGCAAIFASVDRRFARLAKRLSRFGLFRA